MFDVAAHALIMVVATKEVEGEGKVPALSMRLWHFPQNRKGGKPLECDAIYAL
jgi:hypothetical protein